MADDAFRILPLGVGEAFTARHYTTCVALGAAGAWMLVDCPHPVRKMLREAADAAGLALDLDGLLGVALTHLHADHASGLEDFGFYSHFVLNRRARLLAHPEVSARLWDNLLSAGMAQWQVEPGKPPEIKRLDDFFELIPLDASGPVTLGPFAIECRKTIHTIPTTAFKITAGGRTLGLSADTAFDPSLIAWLAPCDLIVHEVTSQEESKVHTPYRELAALPAPLRAKMRLIHYADDFDIDASAIEVLRQGRVYPV
jgi:ribonuclease BN (tRNA processing enzyme)